MNSRSETMNAEKESMMNSSNGMAGIPEPRKEEILFPLENVLPHCAVILVLDTSHSMWGAGLRDMMRSLDHFYKTIQAEQFLNARIDIAAVSMGDNLRMLEEFIPLEHSTLPGMTIRPKGDTPIGQALNLALDQLAEQEAAYRRKGWSSVTPQLLLLSDGQANVGPSSAQELGRLGRGLVKEGVSVSTVGVGSDYNDINTQYGNWTLVVLDGWETTDDRFMVMSKEANENLLGNMFYNRVPLDITSDIDKHTRNYFWNGYCRFGVGFNTWKHIALAVNASSLSDATAL